MRAKPLPTLLFFLVFAEESNVQSLQTGPTTVPVPAQRPQHAPAQFWLKKNIIILKSLIYIFFFINLFLKIMVSHIDMGSFCFFVILSFCYDVLFYIVLLRCLILLSYYKILFVCKRFNIFWSLCNINK